MNTKGSKLRNYDCIQDASTAARSHSNGNIGEKLAEQVLELNGFTNIENLNRSRVNHKYADIYAEKDGERYVISVKARNKYTASKKPESKNLNPSYNLIEGGDVEFAKLAEETRSAKAAWVAIALEDATFDAYFGLLSSLANPRSIPMTLKQTKNYLCLAQGKLHGEDPLKFKNQYKRKSDSVEQEQNVMQNVKLIVLDADGTLTDGTLLYGDDGTQSKAFHVADGLGMVMAQAAGLRVAVLSGRGGRAVERRLAELNVTDITLNCGDKAAAMRGLLAKYDLLTDEAAYVGDDINDLPAFAVAGVKIAVADAAEHLKARADWVTPRRGGAGAVRDAIDEILRRQGRLDAAVAAYLTRTEPAGAAARQ